MKIFEKINRIFNISLFRGDKNITYIQAKEIMKEETKAILLDVRSKQEHEEYHLEGDVCIPLYELGNVEKVIPNKARVIIVYCQSGVRSKKAINILSKMGYTNLYQIKGGIEEI